MSNNFKLTSIVLQVGAGDVNERRKIDLPDTTIFVGPNGAGKSTVLEQIYLQLQGLQYTQNNLVESIEVQFFRQHLYSSHRETFSTYFSETKTLGLAPPK